MRRWPCEDRACRVRTQPTAGLADGRVVRVVVDHRERSSEVYARLAVEPEVVVEVARLQVGDYIVDGALRVERKTFDDFQVSLVDGRLFGQANRLCRAVEPAAIILEGCRSRRRTGVGRRQLQGALLVLSLVFDLPVFRARDAEETVWLLKAISRQARRRVAHRLASRHGNPRDVQARRLHVLASCPGIGPGRAERLLEHFGSLARVFAASEADLLEVRGVGAKTARILGAFAAHDVRRDGGERG